MTDLHTLFQQDWWLDAAAPGAWDAVEVEKGGKVQARLPFTIEERWGARTLTQPALTQSLGPWVQDTGARYSRALSREMSLYSELIEKLPDHDLFHQNFAPEVTNWLPFYWEGFAQTTRYTYTLDMEQGLEGLWAGMDKRNRSRARKAEEELNLVESQTEHLETLLDLVDKTFERQGLETPFERDLAYRLDEAIRKNAQRIIVIAFDDDGNAHSGNYVMGDERRMYALMSGGDPDFRASGAGVLTRWKSISWAQPRTQIYDFEGSMLEGVEHRNRKYGAVQTPFFAISRSNGRVESKRKLHKMRRAPLVAAWKLKEQALGILR